MCLFSVPSRVQYCRQIQAEQSKNHDARQDHRTDIFATCKLDAGGEKRQKTRQQHFGYQPAPEFVVNDM
jgi:hypothetical protein